MPDRRPAPPLRPRVLFALVVLLALPPAIAPLTMEHGAARAAGAPGPIPIGANSLAACPGQAIAPTTVVSGALPEALIGAYLMIPFEVPPGTTQVRVKYCWEGGGNTVDLGLWQAREGATPWAEAQFRGWGGSSHPDVAISAQGFSSEAEYDAQPKGYVPGRTTRGFLPGPLPPGVWAAELGVGFVTPDGDAHADFRVEIELSSDPAFAANPYAPTPYDDTPANPSPGWYLGDLHVHAEHSALGDATMSEVFDFAFGARAEGKAGLDFIALSDYVTPSAWGEIGRYQAAHPGKLILRSAEIITYQGHANQHGALRYVDHRIGGPVYELEPTSGELTQLRGPRLPAEAFAEIEAAGGVVQLNHVTSCPSSEPYCRQTCRGCPWDYSPAQTDYARVQAIEVPSGSEFVFNLFGQLATQFWEQRLADGHRTAVVGVSDSHDAGSVGALDSPIGDGSTAVYAEELSEAGVLAALRAGRTYAKLKATGPDLRFSIEGDEDGTGIMGDAIPDLGGTLRAEVLPFPETFAPLRLRLFRDGVVVAEADVPDPGAGLVQEWRADTPGIYRLDALQVGGLVQALTSSIQVPEPGAGVGGLAAAAALAALRGRARSRAGPS